MNNSKRKYIMAGIALVCILAVVGILKLIRNIQVSAERNQRIELGKQEYDSDEFYIEKVIGEVLNRDADYDKLPLSENFIRKYKGKDIIEYEEGQECNRSETGYIDKGRNMCTVFISHPYNSLTGVGKYEEVRIKYSINEYYELDDLEILNRRVLHDERGEYIYYDMYNNPMGLLSLLLCPWAINDTSNDYLDVSNDFKNKYPNYLTKSILTDSIYKYAVVENIYDTDNEYDFNVKTLDFDKTRYYKATMIPNKEHEEQLDDVIFEFIREEEPMDSKELRSILIDYGNPKIEGWPFDEYK